MRGRFAVAAAAFCGCCWRTRANVAAAAAVAAAV